MRINHKVLSIPPYISASWNNISSLRSKPEGDKHSLIVYLKDGASVIIPDLETILIHAIFNAHARYVESEIKTPIERKVPTTLTNESSIKPFELENMTTMICHNEQERNAPDLPPYILSKVEELSQKMGLSNSQTLPSPEPHCNCPYCQIAKSIQKSTEKPEECIYQEEEEELVTAKDLSFTSWIIHPIKKNLYKVIHPDNSQEEYQVFLESPIGCTCGSKQCEHIRAVLNS